jgi:DNA-binding CsgD family transcriptional regulator
MRRTFPRVPRSVPVISERDRKIAKARKGGASTAELARAHGLSCEGVRRILDRVQIAAEFELFIRKSA